MLMMFWWPYGALTTRGGSPVVCVAERESEGEVMACLDVRRRRRIIVNGGTLL